LIFFIFQCQNKFDFAVGKKRIVTEEFANDAPSAKMRKLVCHTGLDNDQKEFGGQKESKEEPLGHPVAESVSGFFRLVYAVICCQV
jgi:hypothetical protein